MDNDLLAGIFWSYTFWSSAIVCLITLGLIISNYMPVLYTKYNKFMPKLRLGICVGYILFYLISTIWSIFLGFFVISEIMVYGLLISFLVELYYFRYPEYKEYLATSGPSNFYEVVNI